MEINALLGLAVALWKDRAQAGEIESLRKAHTEFLVADADSRRVKKRADILDLSRLKTALRRFRMTYACMAEKCGPVEAIDSYIEKIEKEIEQRSKLKNGA